MNSKQYELDALKKLLIIVDQLREKCPWDMKQNMESLRTYTIEETYELGDAILNNNMEEVKNELGDLLFHILFYAKIGNETDDFDFVTICNDLCKKLIYRHPHIYKNIVVKDAEEVNQNWEKLKLREGNKSVLEGVPKGLPAMVKAVRIQEKAKGVGFDWDNKEQIWGKVEEEIKEFKNELNIGNHEKIEAKFGDFLFSAINYARFLEINPENALEKTNKKFIQRFQYLENIAQQKGNPLVEMSFNEMKIFWEEMKII